MLSDFQAKDGVEFNNSLMGRRSSQNNNRPKFVNASQISTKAGKENNDDTLSLESPLTIRRGSIKVQ